VLLLAGLVLVGLGGGGTNHAAAQPPADGEPLPEAAPDAQPPAEVPPPPPAEEAVPPPPDGSIPPPPPGYGGPATQPTATAAPPVPISPPVEMEEPAQPHEHRGFYLRFGLGFDWLNASLESFGVPLDATGGAVGFYVAIGGNVTDNLALFGDVFFAGAGNANLEGGGAPSVEGRLTIAGTGPGVAWYFMPINMHVSLGAAIMNVQVTDVDGTPLADATGWGLHAQFGKEWWIGAEWGLGVMGQVVLATLEEEQSAFVLGLLASLTFN